MHRFYIIKIFLLCSFFLFSCSKNKIEIKSEQELSFVLKAFSNHRLNFFLFSTGEQVLTNFDLMNQVLTSLNIEHASFWKNLKNRYPNLYKILKTVYR